MLTNGEIKVLGGSIFRNTTKAFFFESLGVGLFMIAKIPFSFRQYIKLIFNQLLVLNMVIGSFKRGESRSRDLNNYRLLI